MKACVLQKPNPVETHPIALMDIAELIPNAGAVLLEIAASGVSVRISTDRKANCRNN